MPLSSTARAMIDAIAKRAEAGQGPTHRERNLLDRIEQWPDADREDRDAIARARGAHRRGDPTDRRSRHHFA